MPRVIAGKARGIHLETNEEALLQPTTDRMKEAVFSSLHHAIQRGEIKTFLDLYAGCGQNGIEAKSRGVETVYFVEQNRKSAQMIKRNLSKTKLAGEVMLLPAQRALQIFQKSNLRFDVIYFDPPWPLLHQFWDEQQETIENLLSEHGAIFIEHSQRELLEIDEQKWEILKDKKYGLSHLLVLTKRYHDE